MWSPISEGFSFLANTLFTLYLFLLMLRVLLPAVNADYYNPLTQFVLKVTQPLIAPLQRILPKSGRMDIAAMLVLFLFACLKNWVLLGLLLHGSVNFLGLSLLSIVQIVELILQFYFFAIIIYVIISWVQPNSNNPFITILVQLTDPILVPARRIIPTIANIDFSPLVVILLIQLISIVIINPLIFYTLQFTVGILR